MPGTAPPARASVSESGTEWSRWPNGTRSHPGRPRCSRYSTISGGSARRGAGTRPPQPLRGRDPLARRVVPAPDAAARASIDACPFARPHPPSRRASAAPVARPDDDPARGRRARRGGDHAGRRERRRRRARDRARGWSWPVAPPDRRGRAVRAPPTPYAAGHRGIDLAVAPGAAVTAAAARHRQLRRRRRGPRRRCRSTTAAGW